MTISRGKPKNSEKNLSLYPPRILQEIIRNEPRSPPEL